MKVLFAAYEAAPIYKVGGLGDIAGSLPRFLKKLGVDIRLVIPGYSFIEKAPFLPGSPRGKPAGQAQVPIYYLSHPRYFRKEHHLLEEKEAWEQFAWFSRQILASLPDWDFWPDIVHLNDWHVALTAVILKHRFAKDDRCPPIATLLTIHNLAYQGVSGPDILKLAGLEKSLCRVLRWDRENRDIDVLMEGIIHADWVNTVSPTYAREILTKDYGYGLDEILKGKEGKLTGVLNGIDYRLWDPQKDKLLPHRYGLTNWQAGKGANKLLLQKSLGLAGNKRPLLGMVTRLVEQKGIDLLLGDGRGKSILEQIINFGAQVVVLGQGEKAYIQKLSLMERKLKKTKKFSFLNRFDEGLAHLIYGASDIFLMPSVFEPCGLAQMIAMRYGSLPVVHRTGGLADTVKDGMTGFWFTKYDPPEFFKRIQAALNLCLTDQKKWGKMVENAMREDFSLEKSAREYLHLYQQVLELKRGRKDGE